MHMIMIRWSTLGRMRIAHSFILYIFYQHRKSHRGYITVLSAQWHFLTVVPCGHRWKFFWIYLPVIISRPPHNNWWPPVIIWWPLIINWRPPHNNWWPRVINWWPPYNDWWPPVIMWWPKDNNWRIEKFSPMTPGSFRTSYTDKTIFCSEPGPRFL